MDENTKPKVLINILNIGRAYKAKGDFEEAFITFENGLNLIEQSYTDEYKRIEREYENLKEINENFKLKNFSSYDDFLKSIVLNDKDIDIDVFSSKKKTQDKKDANNLTDEIYIMPTEDKIKAIGKMLAKLQKNNSEIEIKKIFIGNKEYKDYVVMPLESTDFSIFENFKTDNNLKLFFIKNNRIEIMKELTNPIVSKFNGVISVDHINSNENYISNLVEKADELIKETEINRFHNEYDIDIDGYEPEDLIDKIPETEIENQEENLGIDEYEPTDLIDENPEIEIFEFDKEPEVESNEIQDEVETDEFEFEDVIEKNENEVKETEDEERKYLIKLISCKIATYRQAKQEYNSKNEKYRTIKAQLDAKQEKIFKDQK